MSMNMKALAAHVMEALAPDCGSAGLADLGQADALPVAPWTRRPRCELARVAEVRRKPL